MSSNDFVFKKTTGSVYQVFSSDNYLETADSITFPAGTYGFITAKNADGTTFVQRVGDVIYHELNNMRSAETPVDQNDTSFTINGQKLPIGSFFWIRLGNVQCHAKLSNGVVKIDQATAGFYCINNKVLFEFKKVNLNKPIEIKKTDDLYYVDIAKKKVKGVYFNGEKQVNDGLLLISDTRITIANKMLPTEQFYVQMADDSFTDFTLNTIDLDKFVFQRSFSGVFNFMEHFRCAVIENPAVAYSNKKSTVQNLKVTRYDDTTVTVQAICSWLNDLEYKLYRMSFESVHPAQVCEFNFSTVSVEGDLRKVIKVVGYDTTLIQFKQY
jgi:hypothetical protein